MIHWTQSCLLMLMLSATAVAQSDPGRNAAAGSSAESRQRESEGAAREASGPRVLRVLSYNMHHGEGVDGRLDLPRIARVITRARPDVVALQEVDRETLRSQHVDQAAELARATRMHVVFGANIDLQGGQYGNAVLSRWPLSDARNVHLPRRDNGEQRGVLIVPLGLARCASACAVCSCSQPISIIDLTMLSVGRVRDGLTTWPCSTPTSPHCSSAT